MNSKNIEKSLSFFFKTFLIVMSLVLIYNLSNMFYQYKKYEYAKAQEQKAQFQPTFQSRMKDLECLATNIYYEAGNQSFEGKVAVAQVTLNRVQDGRFGKTICEVVYAKGVISGRIICQFSWVCENKRRVLNTNSPQYIESMEVAKKVLLENFKLSSLEKSLYFHADYVRPGWNKERITKIGQHIFYKEKK